MKKFTHTIMTMALLFLVVGIVNAQNEFITTWETTSSNESITIPTNGSVVNNYDIDWGDGTVETGVTGDASHQYASSGVHTVKISGDIKYIYFNNTGDKDKILTIEQWGNIQWITMNRAFWGCTNLNINATDAPDLSGVTSLNNMFQGASSLNADLSNWDVSTITEMRETFAQADNFNGNITTWDVSNVVTMANMFAQASSFNQPIGSWDVSKVENMSYMLSYSDFNQDISGWNVSSVKNMQWMFAHNPSFNQEIGAWDVSSVTNMSGLFTFAGDFNGDISSWNVGNVTTFHSMFSRATSFNQDISGWDVSKVQTMTAMFFAAVAFNQEIGAWNVSEVLDMSNMFRDANNFNGNISAWNTSKVTKMPGMFKNDYAFSRNLGSWSISLVTDMAGMFDDSGLSIADYDNTLQGWAAQSVQSGVSLGASGVYYCAASAERDNLINNNGWTISDAGEYCIVNIPDANFKAALLANSSINTTDDGEITTLEAKTYSGSLDVSGLSISDLTGIEAFINITSLTANTNSLTSLDLTNNTKLTSIQAYNNNLTSVNLTGLSLLHSVNFTNSDLTSIDLTDQTALTSLYLVGNSLASIDLSANTSITILGIQANGLNSLDITNLSNLQLLYAQDNNLTALDLSNNGSLTTLFLGNNSLQNIDLSQNTLITDLRLMNNSLVTLDLTNNTSLEKIFVNDNLLESFNVANGNNNIVTTFDASGNFNLTCITVDDIVYSQTNWTDVDAGANFSTDCSNVENDITTFSFAEQTGVATIDAATHSIAIEVAFGSDMTNLTPTFTISSGAFVNPVSGVAQDFSSAFTYTVTAENPTAIQDWTVNVMKENVAPSDINLDNSSVDENSAIGTIVGSLSTTDANASDSHTYSLVAGTGDTDNASFNLSGSSLITAEVFDFETKNSYSIRVQSNDGNGGVFEKEFSISVNDATAVEQTITFEALEAVTLETTSFELSASASSGLTVSFASSDESVATVSGTTVTIVGAGTTTITASQSGNGDFAAAANVEQVLTVSKLEQTISFEAIEDQLIEDGSLTLAATASSGLDVSYSIVSGPATVSGNVVTFTGLGEVVVEAAQNGDNTYLVAEPVEQSFKIITITGVSDELREGIGFYPNPVANTLFIHGEFGNISQIQVVDVHGSHVLLKKGNHKQIDLSSLKPGQYIVRIITTDKVLAEQITKH